MTGLRERKKTMTRRQIADSAARLFAEHGYEQVSVADIARAAEVCEHTVYNYFSTKHDLVLNRADEIREQLVRLIAERPDDQSPAEALRQAAHQYGQRVRHASPEQLRGELPVLCAGSPVIRRLLLESRDRTAEEMAAAIMESTAAIHPAIARAHAAALISVFQMIVDHIGRRTLDGAAPATVADELALAVDVVLDDLARHFDTAYRTGGQYKPPSTRISEPVV